MPDSRVAVRSHFEWRTKSFGQMFLVSAGACVQALTLHTNFGDLKLELYCDHTPKACYNFLALCANKYYDETKFHRNIPGFMIQGGDPTGTGKGGTSIFDTGNGKFEDEIVPALKHDKAGIVSMANSGANTNGSLHLPSPCAQLVRVASRSFSHTPGS
jgi:hypothetical protein